MKAMRRLAALALLAGAASACLDADAAPAEMTVYATPTCGCCGAWVDHVRDSGIAVRVVYQDDLSAIRREYRVPNALASCHMGVVEGFAVEGHVPADVIHRLLRERPEVLGIAVPGMPIGSPGMEHPDGHVMPYEVISFDESGPIAVFEFRN
jgi:hypothetical protein